MCYCFVDINITMKTIKQMSQISTGTHIFDIYSINFKVYTKQKPKSVEESNYHSIFNSNQGMPLLYRNLLMPLFGRIINTYDLLVRSTDHT